jgi:hypothetical protein
MHGPTIEGTTPCTTYSGNFALRGPDYAEYTEHKNRSGFNLHNNIPFDMNWGRSSLIPAWPITLGHEYKAPLAQQWPTNYEFLRYADKQPFKPFLYKASLATPIKNN